METPTPASDTPRTIDEAIRYFSDPDTCVSFLVPLRWPGGVACPRCGGGNPPFLRTRRVWKCMGCTRQFSVKVGTVMEDSPLGLDKWLTAIWRLANATGGVSSHALHRALGVTQKAAWFLLHRVRLALRAGTAGTPGGGVEAGETVIGGKARLVRAGDRAEKVRGRGAGGKAVVVMGVPELGLDPTMTPFSAFRTLAAKLVQVPRAEADKQESKYQADRSKISKRGPKPKGWAAGGPLNHVRVFSTIRRFNRPSFDLILSPAVGAAHNHPASESSILRSRFLPKFISPFFSCLCVFTHDRSEAETPCPRD